MSRSTPATAVLFWLMVLAGGATLIPCLLLPPLYEYRVGLAARAAAEKRLADLEHRLLLCQKQIDALQNDPAYLERLAWKELGLPMKAGVTTLMLESGQPSGAAADSRGGTTDPNAAAVESRAGGAAARSADPLDDTEDGATAARTPDQKLATDAAAYSDRLMEYYPVLRVFVLDQTRPVLILLSSALIVLAVMLLGFPRRARREALSGTVRAGK